MPERRGRPRRAGGRPPRRRSVDPVRRAAYDVLRAVRVDDAYTNLALPHVLADRGLSGRDAAFVTELASGSLRRRGTYDAVLAACVDRPLGRVEAAVLEVLRLGAHQLLGMRVPAHAAISTSVDLARDRSGAGAGGFVNAVLRRVAAHDLDAWVRRVAPDPGEDLVGFAVIAHAHPRWIVEELASALARPRASPSGTDRSEDREAGLDGGLEAELDELLAADNRAPRVVLAARPGVCDRGELPGEPTRYSPYGVVLAGGDPGALPAVAEGRAGVQDEGSQLVALALARAAVSGRDRRWLDLCAGPGGKAALLAALAASRGAGLLANERQPHRARLVRHAVRALGGIEPGIEAGVDGGVQSGTTSGVVQVVAGDGLSPPWPAETFDRVLVDAPCTGLGALRRRPEARWRRTREDLTDLVALQSGLLEVAADSVRPGGVVLYATCSPVLAETAGVLDAVLSARSDLHVEDASPLLPELTEGAPAESAAGPVPGTLQLWPHRHGTDAMFLALLRRTEQKGRTEQ